MIRLVSRPPDRPGPRDLPQVTSSSSRCCIWLPNGPARASSACSQPEQIDLSITSTVTTARSGAVHPFLDAASARRPRGLLQAQPSRRRRDRAAVPKTLVLALISMVIALIIAIPIGICRRFAAGRASTRLLDHAEFIVYSTPSFFLGHDPHHRLQRKPWDPSREGAAGRHDHGGATKTAGAHPARRSPRRWASLPTCRATCAPPRSTTSPRTTSAPPGPRAPPSPWSPPPPASATRSPRSSQCSATTFP